MMIVCLAVLLMVVSGDALAQQRDLPLAHWQHTKWTGRELPAGLQARLIVQTPDGYLWMAAQNALIRFDGVRFTVIDSTYSPVLRPSEAGRFVPLFVDRQGRLWIDAPGGARLTYVNGTFESAPTVDRADDITDPASPSLGNAEGLIWFKDRRPFRRVAGRMVPMTLPPELANVEIFTINPAADGGLFIGTRNHGLWHVMRSGGVRQYGSGSLRLLIQARDGTIWATGVSVGGTARLDGDRWIPLLSQVDGSQLTSQEAAEGPDGAIWFQTRLQGILRYHQGVTEQFTTRDGLSSNTASDVLVDSRNTVWVATEAGVDRLRRPAFASLDPAQRLTQEIRPRYAFDERGGIWLSEALGPDMVLLEHGLLGDGSQPLTARRFKLARGERGQVFTTSRHGVWVGGATGLIHLRNDGTQVRAGDLAGVPRRQRTVGLETRDGTLWVGFMPGGIGRIASGKFSYVPLGTGVPPYVEAVVEDGRGRVWIALGAEIVIVERDSVTETVPLPRGATISMLAVEHGDTLWAATDRSVIRLTAHAVAEVLIPGLRERIGTADIAIAQGKVWLAGTNGVARISLADLHAAADGDSTRIELERFDVLDGLPAARTQSTNAALSLEVGLDNRVWINTAAGIAVTVPPLTRVVSDTPHVRIEETIVDGALLTPNARLAPRPERIDIHFTATGLELAERARLQYQLEGEDEQWVDATLPRVATYNKLDPGRYVFRVRALDERGAPVSTEASLLFRVPTAWNQTWWYFTLLTGAIAATAAGSAVLWQRRRHRQGAEILRRQYEATLAERARIAQDLHDTLLQGFAGLTLQLKAAELAIPAQPELAVETIHSMQQVARQSLREARERVWDMREVDLGSDDLGSALEGFAHQRTTGTGIGVSVFTSGTRRRLSRSLEDAAFRIGREAITNAVKHAEARRIEVSVDFGADVLRLHVRDDGRGFTPDDADEARRNGHIGLLGIRDRVARVGGRYDIRAPETGGTLVAVELPIGAD